MRSPSVYKIHSNLEKKKIQKFLIVSDLFYGQRELGEMHKI